MRTAALSDRDVLAALGADVLAGAGYSPLRVKMWKQRGISWPERGKIAELAERRAVAIPADFLTRRRTISKSAKPKRARKVAA